MVARGALPPPIKLGPGTTVWNLDEVERVLAERGGA
jgi:predicted DNA-binding transcriptional regulator AlpA